MFGAFCRFEAGDVVQPGPRRRMMHEEILGRLGHWAREGDFPRLAASIQAGMTEQRVAAVTQLITPTLLCQHIAVYSLHLLRVQLKPPKCWHPHSLYWEVLLECSNRL